jgi:hypothetical protein
MAKTVSRFKSSRTSKTDGWACFSYLAPWLSRTPAPGGAEHARWRHAVHRWTRPARDSARGLVRHFTTRDGRYGDRRRSLPNYATKAATAREVWRASPDAVVDDVGHRCAPRLDWWSPIARARAPLVRQPSLSLSLCTTRDLSHSPWGVTRMAVEVTGAWSRFTPGGGGAHDEVLCSSAGQPGRKGCGCAGVFVTRELGEVV